ncbi:MAG: hypothetical protein ABIZ49_04320, partial [Opitutaceae bacterium]
NRQREIVHQYAQADRRILPPSGIPLGGLQTSFDYLAPYENQLRQLTFPPDDAKNAPYPLYDRWSDAYNVTTEFVIANQGRSLASLAYWAAQTPTAQQSWRPVRAQIAAPGIADNSDKPLTFRLTAPGLDLTGARIVWEARDAEPFVGDVFAYRPKNTGTQWVEAEAQFPDGRRVFAANNFTIGRPMDFWVDGALPEGAWPSTTGGDTWNWIQNGTKPSELARHATPQHVSEGTAPLHEHTFSDATASLEVQRGDILFVWAFLDPKNPPKQIMLSWNDGSWDHRAYWGANLIQYGHQDTPGRRPMGTLPSPGQWVRLEVPARLVDLEGRTIKGMSFSVQGGRVTWDAAGKMSPKN